MSDDEIPRVQLRVGPRPGGAANEWHVRGTKYWREDDPRNPGGTIIYSSACCNPECACHLPAPRTGA